MKRKICITLELIFVILMLTTSSYVNNEVVVKIKNENVLTVDKIYKNEAINLKLKDIHLLELDGNFDLLVFYIDIDILKDNILWYPESSQIVINDGEEYTIPFLLDNLSVPLYKSNEQLELIAYVTNVSIKNIKTIQIIIQEPVMYKSGDRYDSLGREFNIKIILTQEDLISSFYLLC